MPNSKNLAEKFRWFPTPGYGVCGGADRSCVYEAMDPMDKLFFKHDNDMYEAHQIEDLERRASAEIEADHSLHEALAELTDEDMKKIPFWQWRRPFFKRAYAKAYRAACLELFK